MNRKGLTLLLFIVAAAIQLAVPASMIQKREMTLQKGRQYKFKTAPVDPYDAFRGRYVALRMEQNEARVDPSSEWGRGEIAYVVIEQDEEGFAKLGEAGREKPKEEDYIKLKVHYKYDNGKLRVELPFDRYYMNEEDAPAAEIAYRQHSTRKQRDAYVTVRVLDGFAILEELYVAEKPIGEFLLDQAAVEAE